MHLSDLDAFDRLPPGMRRLACGLCGHRLATLRVAAPPCPSCRSSAWLRLPDGPPGRAEPLG